MKNLTTLIIDDEVNLTKSLSYTLKQEGISCLAAHDGKSGIEAAEKKCPDVILLDVNLPGESGLDILSDLKKKLPHAPVIMISAYGDTKDAVRAIKQGAVDYLTKPFNIDELITLLHKSVSIKKLKSEVRYYREKASLSPGIVGESEVMKKLDQDISLLANSHVKTILILGETGVGKTLVAREIHDLAFGEKAPFIEINCASLTEELVEAELFGAEKGSYTGAESRRTGLVEIAENGTLFLDEIGELSLNLQAKLLTLLESWKYRPIGSTREKQANIRVIAATNRDLEKSVGEGFFRQDLFFRLNIMPVRVPNLNTRRGDAWILANYFSDLLSRREGCQAVEFHPETKKIFNSYKWPGNVRELKNFVERLTILHPGQTLYADQFPAEMSQSLETEKSFISQSLEQVERELVSNVLKETNGHKGKAAEKLGISRHALKRRIQKLGIG